MPAFRQFMKYKVTKKKARCKRVLAIVNNHLGTFDMIREETYPPAGDFADGPLTVAIVKWEDGDGMEIQIPINCVVFLKD